MFKPSCEASGRLGRLAKQAAGSAVLHRASGKSSGQYWSRLGLPIALKEETKK